MTHATKHAIIVDPFSSGRFLMDEFAARGIASIAVLSAPIAPAFQPHFLPEKFAEVIAFDGDAAALAARLSTLQPACVIAGLETGVELADRLGQLLGLPHNDPDTSVARRDKYAMQEALRAKGVRAVKQCLVGSVESARLWLATHRTWPVVVKPSNSAGSDNVSICRDMDHAVDTVAAVLAADNLFGKRNTEVLLQEYLDGREWVVDTVSCDGRHVVTNVTRYLKVVTADANIVYRHAEFMTPDPDEHRDLIEYALAVNDALGIRYGSAHTEIIKTARGPTLVEVNARMHGGNAIKSLGWCNRVTQLDLSVDAHLDPEAFARKAQEGVRSSSHLMVHFLIAPAAGKVESVIAPQVLAGLKSYKAHALPAVGDEIEKTVSLTSAPGAIWLMNDNADELLADQQALIEMEQSGRLYTLAPAEPSKAREADAALLD